MSIIWKQHGLDAYLASYTRRQTDPVVAHGHEGYELLYYLEGTARIRLKNRQYPVGPGDLVVFRPRMVHREIEAAGVHRKICLRFKSDQFRRIVPFPPQSILSPVISLPWKERFHNLFEQIVLEKDGVDKWSVTLIDTYFTQLITLLWRALQYYKKDTGDNLHDRNGRISQVIDFIHNNLSSQMTLTSLAKTACMSESHFSHVFKSIKGQSPKNYVVNSRLEKARELLLTTTHSTKTVGRMLGWNNAAHFTRLFKKVCGCPPGEFRGTKHPNEPRIKTGKEIRTTQKHTG